MPFMESSKEKSGKAHCVVSERMKGVNDKVNYTIYVETLCGKYVVLGDDGSGYEKLQWNVC